MKNTRYSTQDTEHKIQHTGYSTQYTAHKIQHTIYSTQDTANRLDNPSSGFSMCSQQQTGKFMGAQY